MTVFTIEQVQGFIRAVTRNMKIQLVWNKDILRKQIQAYEYFVILTQNMKKYYVYIKFMMHFASLGFVERQIAFIMSTTY